MNKSLANGFGLAMILMVVSAAFLTYPKLAAAGEVSEVPSVDAVEVVDERSKWDPRGWKDSITSWADKDERHASELAKANAALDAAIGIQRHHDAQLEDAKAQVLQTEAHLEGIIAELKREKAATDLLNKTLDESIRDLQDKDNSLMFVSGCWVPLDSGQDATQ